MRFHPTGLCAMIALLSAIASPAAAQTAIRTVDAANAWVFVSLATPDRLLEVPDPTTSPEWDIAFLGTEVMLNGGGAGPGGVTATCICQNRGASNDEIQFMTADSELPDFERIGRSDLPSDPDAWHPAAFATSQWYRYNLRDEHFVWPTYDVYLVRRGDAVYKVQIIGYYGPAGEPRQITLRSAAIAP